MLYSTFPFPTRPLFGTRPLAARLTLFLDRRLPSAAAAVDDLGRFPLPAADAVYTYTPTILLDNDGLCTVG